MCVVVCVCAVVVVLALATVAVCVVEWWRYVKCMGGGGRRVRRYGNEHGAAMVVNLDAYTVRLRNPIPRRHHAPARSTHAILPNGIYQFGRVNTDVTRVCRQPRDNPH